MRRSEAAPPQGPRPSRAAPLALFALVATASAAGGILAYAASSAELRAQKERELQAIAALKVEELERWRDERFADAQAMLLEPSVLAAVTAAGGEEPRVRAELERWFESMRSLQEYAAAAVVDREGTIRYTLGAVSALEEATVRAVALRAIADRRSLLSDVHRHHVRDDFHLSLVAPIAGADGEIVAAVVLRVDPHRYLYRMLQTWPGPSATAETLLVRADGARAAIVNEPRHWQDDPAALQIPLDSDDPAARAAAGAQGVLEGDDYRGRRVLAAALAVPDSTWTLVAKIDQDEAFAPLAERRIWVVVSVTALVVAAAFAAWLWWRAQAERLERQRFRDEAERGVLARRLEHLAKSALDMVIVADERGRIVEANDRTAELLGYVREELLGLEVRALRDPATVGDYDARVAQEIAPRAISFETRYRRKDGTTFPVELSVRSDEIDGRRWFHGVARDITERKRAEAALRESEAKFRAAFEGATLGIVLIAPDGGLLESNRAFRAMLGHSEDELRRMRIFDVAAEPEVSGALHASLRDGAQESFERARRYRRKDGSIADVVVRSTALRDAAGAFRYSLVVVEDVSERKRLEAQLMLADRMVSVGTLAAGVAHEINNPLAFILANLDFALGELGDGTLAPDVARALTEAKDGAVRVREIVRDLKTFSRADEHAKERVDVARVLRSALSLAANELRHRAHVEVSLAPAPPILGSEHRLGQVFLNLLINAAQAIPEGHAGEHRIRASTGTAPDGRAIVEISDTGTGIPPEVLPRIFDPFFTTKPVGVGTGLGLAICHGIVTALGGEIAVETAVGRGTTFRVLLPVAGDAPVPAPEHVAPAPAGRGRILVVDDEPLVGRAVQRILSAHDVETCASGAAALARLASRERFDLVLCDLMMPEMTGMELHARLAAEAPELADRMVFLTGGAFTPSASAFLDAVPNPRVEKPFEPAALRALVARLLPASALRAARPA